MPTILYCHRESGHSYKVALALTLMNVPFEPAAEALESYWTGRMQADLDRLDDALNDSTFLAGNAPTIADVSCCGYLFWADQADVDLAPWPAVVSWLDRIRSQPRWRAPYDLIEDRFPIRPGTRT